MCFSTLFFDLDDTLYPSNSGLWDAIRDRMNEFMYERVGLSRAEIPILRRFYFETYGTTLRGLQIHYNVDANEYLAYVHDLPLEQYIRPDPELRLMLISLNRSKWIFTNADDNHARRVLTVLGLNDCFTGIAEVRSLGFHSKPDVEAYRRAMSLAGETDPHQCVLFDDTPRNLAPGRDLGFFTVLVGSREPNSVAHFSISRLNDLPQAMPELWAN
jgi:putative hydrolase of the HAD superfamily